MAVENEIQDTLGDAIVNDDEYLDAAEWYVLMCFLKCLFVKKI